MTVPPAEPRTGPPIRAIQRELKAEGLDAWLFYDFHHRDPIATHILNLEQNGMGTRRWFYLIPARGTPRKLVHRIESAALDSLPGRKFLYAGQDELYKNLARVMDGVRTVAMQYSPRNAIPYISLVDAGTVELVRGAGCRISSSADLVQKFEACWTPEQYRSHLEAGSVIERVRQEAFSRAAAQVQSNTPLSEYQLQQWIVEQFRAGGVISAEPPIVAVGPHTADPHYEPRPEGSSPIRRGDLLLLDIWGKLDRPGSVYYDITWVGYLGGAVPEKYAKIFAVARQARDTAIAFVQQAVARERTIQGWQVDRTARDVIGKAGYAKYFVHRTGHNIGQEVHGNGANMDGLETHDTRRVLPQTCFSVEPGIYLPENSACAPRSICMWTAAAAARVTSGPVQVQSDIAAARLSLRGKDPDAVHGGKPSRQQGNDMESTEIVTSKPNPALAGAAAIAGWIVPGLGHLMLRRWRKALVYFFAVGALAVAGVLMRGSVFTFNGDDIFDRLGFFAELGSGIFYFPAHRINPAGGGYLRAAGDYGTRLIATAGVLNLLCVMEAFQLGLGRRANG